MENIGLIREIAWSFHKTTGIDWGDLFQEAALAYLEAYPKYDSTKGKVTTYMWHVMNSRLVDFIRKERTQTGLWDDITNVNPSYQFHTIWSTIPMYLSKEFEIIFENIHKVDCSTTRDETERVIRKILLDNGVEIERIDKVCKEIRAWK